MTTNYVISTTDGTIHEPVLSGLYDVCPVCGDEDPQLWADDGESDRADYIECNQCGLNAALVPRDDTTRTLNGLPWPK